MLVYFANIQENWFHEKKFGELSVCNAIRCANKTFKFHEKDTNPQNIEELKKNHLYGRYCNCYRAVCYCLLWFCYYNNLLLLGELVYNEYNQLN